MSVTTGDRPGRWVTACPQEAVDYCDAVGMGDFVPSEWRYDPNNNNELLWIDIPLNPNGLIATIDSHPDGTLYDPSGAQADTVTWSTSEGAYYPNALFGPNSIVGQWSVLIPGIDVTLKTGDSCQVNFTQVYNAPLQFAYSFTHFRAGDDLDLTFSQNGGVGFIDWGDGGAPEFFDFSAGLTAKSHTYSVGGVITTSISCVASDVTDVRFNTMDVISVDIDALSSLAAFSANNNSIISVNNPTSSAAFTIYSLQTNNLSGTFDASTLTGLGGAFALSANTLLVGFTGGTSSTAFSQFDIDSCDLFGTLVISGYTGLAGLVRFQGNSSLTGITFPASSGSITTLWFDACDMGYTDMTNLTLASTLDFRCQNNAMTTAEINHILVDLDATLPGTGTGTLQMAGTNSAPDGSSGGYDGTTAKSNLVAAGYTVTTT